MSKVVVGIDPGWASFGLAITREGILYSAHNYVPREHGTIVDFIEFLDQTVFSELGPVNEVFIERFVAYEGKHSSVTEPILMLIGALTYYFKVLENIQSNESLEPIPIRVTGVRAIEWKPKVCRFLVRTKGFTNPYSKFDKDFSCLAAKRLCGSEVGTNHEADAICLSYLSQVEEYDRNRLSKGVKP